ncbi:2-keto-4-methylthiobutyrate aminotransferase apoenzyme [Siphonobacter aquaeclarae]|uniref:2-keto-4-methylthiobutyrate aminotransferase apoenzyme n=2 Tax=Siphonobacter aquaeclarae TaxID=563176 RepID=A0A1G9R5P9_9BACT|nr:2-keto-4-methylthiobutyrate aminotransferase apoenzyme [Siphonobacter aquaeclarae]
MLQSKLPHVGTTIFTVMSGLANEHQALNLSQGFPGFDCDPALSELVAKYTRGGFNQYAPMTGVPPLRQALAAKAVSVFGLTYDPDTEVTVTSGATEALFAALTAVIRPGDEVLIFEPAYDSYAPAIELNGGIPVYITPEGPAYAIDWTAVAGKISSRTRAVIVNTPHNPTGYVWTQADLDALAALLKPLDAWVVSDEVYEHITFDSQPHLSPASHPDLKDRTFLCGSLGKTFHVTGWKIGFCLAPKALSAEFRKIHQYLTFSTVTPVQYALAEYLGNPEHYLTVAAFYQRKRDLFVQALEASAFRFVPSQGTFFQNVSYGHLSQENDYDLAVRLTKQIGVASIPVSVFYHRKDDHKQLRFCFAKDDTMLLEAAERLSRLSW